LSSAIPTCESKKTAAIDKLKTNSFLFIDLPPFNYS
jgi:hypothetical protein